jgi:ankyrin repeat protein
LLDAVVTGSAGETPLHVAAIYGQGAVVQVLLDGGAAVDAVDACGCTALHLAVQQDHPSVVQQLLAAHAAVDAADAWVAQHCTGRHSMATMLYCGFC